MRAREVGLLLIAITALLVSAQAATGSGTSPRKAINPSGDPRAFAISTPFPDYPLAARERHLTGSGVARLDIDQQTGAVASAQMEVSTGYGMLDSAALAAFRRWRFQPGTVTKVKIPITFTIGSGRFTARPVLRRTVPLPTDHHVKVHALSGKGFAMAIYTPAPQYPASAYAQHLTGKGVVVLTIDANTGIVTEARMQPSTGHAELDAAALKAFRQWRFERGTSGDFKIPVTYKL